MTYSNNSEILVPWYGTWPPEVRGDAHNMKDNRAWNVKIILPLFIVFLLGIILLLVSFFVIPFELKFWRFITESFAAALLVSGILGYVIDRSLRQNIVEDAFQASIGYLLPDELKPEMEWVYSQTVIANPYHLRCRISRLSDKLVRLHVEIDRTDENVTQKPIKKELGLDIDEWLHEKPSEILELGYKKEGEEWKDISVKAQQDPWKISSEHVNIDIPPKGKVSSRYVYEETKENNDSAHFNSRVAVKYPLVVVEIDKECEDLDYVVGFAHREEQSTHGSNAYRLPGTLMPHQAITIRWWEKDKSKEQTNESTEKREKTKTT